MASGARGRRLEIGVAAIFLLAATLWAGIAAALDLGQMKGAVYGSGNRNLVVLLHGDGGPGYMDRFAARIASAHPGTTVVALTRPAFTGETGRSPGQNASRDHYTRSNNRALAESLEAMKNDLRPSNLIVVGHSGGAAQLGTIVGKHPGIVDVAILAGCPCDVPSWRIHRRGSNNWNQSESPHRFVDRIPASTQVLAITGADDTNTLPRFAETYVAAAQRAGANIQFFVPGGVSHDWSSLRRPVGSLLEQTLR